MLEEPVDVVARLACQVVLDAPDFVDNRIRFHNQILRQIQWVCKSLAAPTLGCHTYRWAILIQTSQVGGMAMGMIIAAILIAQPFALRTIFAAEGAGLLVGEHYGGKVRQWGGRWSAIERKQLVPD